MNRKTLGLVLVVLVLTALSMPALAAAAEMPTATVNATTLNVRSGPGTGYAIMTAVHSGDQLTVTGRSTDGWLQVALKDGRTGWISGAFASVSGDLSGVPIVTVAPPARSSTPAKSSTPARARSGSTMVFQLASGGPIYAVNPNGTGLRQLTTGMDPAISPDGKQVAFTRWDGVANGVTGSLWVINTDGSGERKVIGDILQPKSPTWSPDGTQIIVSVQHGGRLNYLCLIDGQLVEVPNPPEDTRCLGPDPNWAIRQIDVATGKYQDLPHELHSYAPTWDPANSWHVVYRSSRGLESLDISRGASWLLKSGGSYVGPVFSPDGKRIAVTFKQNDHWEVHVLNADGTGEARITETPATVLAEAMVQGKTPRSWDNAAPAWSPDGSKIAFITNRTGQYEIWVMNADGSNQRPLLTAAALGGNIKYDGVDERVISWR